MTTPKQPAHQAATGACSRTLTGLSDGDTSGELECCRCWAHVQSSPHPCAPKPSAPNTTSIRCVSIRQLRPKVFARFSCRWRRLAARTGPHACVGDNARSRQLDCARFHARTRSAQLHSLNIASRPRFSRGSRSLRCSHGAALAQHASQPGPPLLTLRSLGAVKSANSVPSPTQPLFASRLLGTDKLWRLRVLF
jgi:hypothetical protein